MNRVARVERLTHETQIMVELDLDGIGVVEVGTGVPFFDHMLAQLGKHGSLDLTVRAKGDVEIDAHHTVEDTAITLGQALKEALGDKSGIARFGNALVPLDETLVQAAVDLSGRPVRGAPRAGRHGPADRQLRHHADPAHLRVAGVRRGDLPARPGDRGPQRASHRGSPVQGGGPGIARGGGAGPAGRRHPEHEGRARMTPRVVVLDYGSGNLRSAQRALERVGAQVEVTADPDAALDCDGLAVPGVGAFAACMAGLRAVGGDKLIARRLDLGRPVLGICVGMQVLFAAGVEHGVQSDGCGAWPGTVERLDAGVLPHMGWNTVAPPPGSALFAGIAPGTRFYFVHSYALRSPGAHELAAAGA